MSMEIIKRVQGDSPQIAYNSEGRITVRIPQSDGDVLIVFIGRYLKSLLGLLKAA